MAGVGREGKKCRGVKAGAGKAGAVGEAGRGATGEGGMGRGREGGAVSGCVGVGRRALLCEVGTTLHIYMRGCTFYGRSS